MSTIWPCLSGFPSGGFGDLFWWISDHGKVGELEMFVLICWSLWTEKNLVVFQGKILGYEHVLAQANRTKDHYNIFVRLPERVRSPPSSLFVWKPPSPGILKINVDDAVFSSSNFFSVGLVGRDNFGTLIFAEGRIMQGDFSPKTAEFIAVREGLSKAISLVCEELVVESD